MAKHIWNGYKRIKRQILKGGVVVAPRAFGKTEALMELLNEDFQYVVLTHTSDSKEFFLRAYFEKYGEKIPHRVFSSEREMFRNMRGRGFNFQPEKHILIDEFFMTRYYSGPFFAAVSSYHHPIRIVRPSKKQQEYIKTSKQSEHLSPHMAEAWLMLDKDYLQPKPAPREISKNISQRISRT